MTSSDVLQLIDSLPEAILLVSPGGRVLGANTACQEFLNTTLGALNTKTLSDLTEDPAEKVRQYLSMCSRTRQPVPGALTVRVDADRVACRTHGAVLNVTNDSPMIWLRLTPREPANSRFFALNQQVLDLNREIARRQRADNLIAGQKRVLEMLAQDSDLRTVLESLATTVEQLLRGEVRSSILLLDEAGTRLVHGAAPNLPEFYTEAIDALEIGPSAGSCGTAAFLGTTVIAEDIQTDERWKEHREVAAKAGLRACWSTPITGNTGKVLGTFAIYYSRPKTPTEHEIAVIEVMTRTASIAIEKARAAQAKEQAEEALRRTEKLAAAGRLAATIAHEINNPLEAVTNLLYLASTQPDIGDRARQFLKMAEEELARVAHISKQTLGFYRETGAPELVDVAELLDSVLSIYSGKTRSKNITVQRNYMAAPPVLAARGELRQLFSNLVANAIDAMGYDGVLTAEVCTCSLNNDQRVCIRVRDNGIGISPEDQKRLFEPFFTTKVGVGTGLGLWVSKGIVEKYKGYLRVESSTQLPARGSVFSIELPPAPAAGHAEPAGATG